MDEPKKVVIVGGGTAGTEAAFQLRKLDKECEITILERGANTLFSPCSLPYVISGEIEKFEDVFIFSEDDYQRNNINLVLGAEVEKIDCAAKKLFFESGGETQEMAYDALVLALGSSSRLPPIAGLSEAEFFTLKTLEDARRIKETISADKKVLMIGAGYIGVELAYSLNRLGAKVTLVEAGERILASSLDRQMSEVVGKYLEESGVEIITNCLVDKIEQGKAISGERTFEYDFLVVSSGVGANIELASSSGLEVGRGIVVDETMRTNDGSIFACGDCVECKSLVTKKPGMSQLGTTAVRQAAVVAENISGKNERFLGVLNTSVSKIGELVLGSAGITDDFAKREGIETVSSVLTGSSRAEYYPGGKDIKVKLVSNLDGQIIGAQLVGHEEILGRINQLSLAISRKLTLKELSTVEMAYNPCLSPIHDPIAVCAQICEKKRNLAVRKN